MGPPYLPSPFPKGTNGASRIQCRASSSIVEAQPIDAGRAAGVGFANVQAALCRLQATLPFAEADGTGVPSLHSLIASWSSPSSFVQSVQFRPVRPVRPISSSPSCFVQSVQPVQFRPVRPVRPARPARPVCSARSLDWTLDTQRPLMPLFLVPTSAMMLASIAAEIIENLRPLGGNLTESYSKSHSGMRK